MEIFVDDERNATDFDLTFRSEKEFIDWVKENPNTNVDLVSLDYFLADEFVSCPTGKDIAIQLTQLPHQIRRVQVHSSYYDGACEIYTILNEYARSRVNPTFRGCDPYLQKVLPNGEIIDLTSFRLETVEIK